MSLYTFIWAFDIPKARAMANLFLVPIEAELAVTLPLELELTEPFFFDDFFFLHPLWVPQFLLPGRALFVHLGPLPPFVLQAHLPAMFININKYNINSFT
jgi:hypothetical protein